MKFLFILCCCSTSFTCDAAEVTSLLPEVNLGQEAGRIFVTTNKYHVPFYILPREIDLRAKLGKELNQDDLTGVFLTTDPEHRIDVVNGEAVIRNFYRKRGRYAVIHDDRISLIDFEVVISQNQADKDLIQMVNSGTKSFNVSADFLRKLNSLKKQVRKEEK